MRPRAVKFAGTLTTIKAGRRQMVQSVSCHHLQSKAGVDSRPVVMAAERGVMPRIHPERMCYEHHPSTQLVCR
jgi:hypothetical protein